MSTGHWSNVSYLDAIRPDPGWRTEYALLASYSADMVALVAALLALAGLDDDRGSGSKVDFAKAVDALADRVRLVAQAGRLIAPLKPPKILAILDRYVCEVNLHESVASWHPKVALAKQASEDGSTSQWRLWMGSRNLTRDLAWDVGLTLVGRIGGSGSEVPGIPELGATLAQHAKLPGLTARKIRSELQQVRWDSPPGCALKSLRLFTGTESRTVPPEPPKVKKLVIVSPFLDGTIIEALGKWGDAQTSRTLVSTRSEMTKLAAQAGKPLAAFDDLLLLDAPAPDDLAESDAADRENAGAQDEEPEPRGLHAKLIYAEGSGGRRIWTGSANATRRGWIGPNSEVIAEMEVTSEVTAGLDDFVKSALTIRHDELGDAVEPDEIEQRLEEARKHVAGFWAVTQRVDDSMPTLVSATDPNPPDDGIELSVGLLGAAQVLWPRGATTLPLLRVAEGDVTELVMCQLTMGDASLSWLQRAPIDPRPGEERDRQALARYLDPRTFLLWVRSLLTGEPCGDGGGDWDDQADSQSRRALKKSGPTWWAPTIEEVLKSWSRDPSSLTQIDKRLRQYLKLYEQQTDSELTPDEWKVVADFHATWQVVCRSLLMEQQR
ncbi:phospholipase D family protein [Methylocystis parvus]|uniref:Phospholipase D-like domain-containing protein n=1 Tax=Methylocystis parvus TaxID=134 RepID=A0A6B8MBI8_9HYPH|nr:phospholipase D family protein [Methylocystis parvus]QGM99978.1 hypothetical protein F7D14_20575 [Methylocystis parvus]WBK02209.1 phospholipase D family protein [Methylocystis parvus OBBP]